MTLLQNLALILNLASDLTCDHPVTSCDQQIEKHAVIALRHTLQYQNFALIPNLASDLTCDHPVTSCDQQLAKHVGTGLWHMVHTKILC